MSCVFKAFYRLKSFSLLSPLLQWKQIRYFLCRHKYVVFIIAATIVYFGYVLYLSIYRLPPLKTRARSMIQILEFGRSMANACTVFLLIVFLMIDRKAYAKFRCKLHQFDCTYNQLVEPSIKHAAINRPFWIEIATFSVYMCIILGMEIKFNETTKDWRDILFWSCEVGEQGVYAYVVFHMKNCACKLITRFRQVNRLLKKITTSNKIESYDRKLFRKSEDWQLEKAAHMLDILFKARDHLQEAVGSTMLLMFTYNLFAVALSSYIMVSSNVYERNNVFVRHFYHITIKYLCFELPLILRDFYFTIYFHHLGNMVSHSLLFNLFKIILLDD